MPQNDDEKEVQRKKEFSHLTNQPILTIIDDEKYMICEQTLIKSGGGNWPDEARQPARRGTVLIPAAGDNPGRKIREP